MHKPLRIGMHSETRG